MPLWARYTLAPITAPTAREPAVVTWRATRGRGVGKLSDSASGVLGTTVVVGMFALAIFMFAVGWAGIEHEFGKVWGWVAAGLALVLRFTLPLTVGVFYCARDIWGWHWAAALLLAAPGLALMIPGMVATGIQVIRQRR